NILGNISDAVFITDREGKFTFVCTNVHVIFGYSIKEVFGLGKAEELLGKPVFEISELESRGEIQNIEREVTDKAGRIHQLLITVKRVSLQQGDHLYTCRDITERKLAETKLRSSDRRFRTIFETTSQGFWEIGEDGRTVDLNPAACAFLGRERNDVIGRYVTEFLSEKETEKVKNQMRIRSTGRSGTYELSFNRADGSVLHCLVKGTPYFDADGNITGSFAMLTDITEQKAAEEERLAQLNFLESLERIDHTIRGATDLNKMLQDAMETVQDIFQSDRAWLLYPCDPEAPTYSVPVEYARPEYPGAFRLDLDVPMKPGADEVCIDLLASEDPVTYGPSNADRPLYKEVTEQFGVRSQMIMAVYPKIGKPWMFGMHQCSYAREWTRHERRLFKEIGRRLSDGLSSTLLLRGLLEREARLQSILHASPVGIGLVSNGVLVHLNERICEMVGRLHEELYQQSARILYPDDNEYEAAVGDVLYRLGQVNREVETQWIRKDGKIIDVLLGSSPLDSSDLSKGITFIALDITDRKLAEKERKEHIRFLESLNRIEKVMRGATDLERMMQDVLDVVRSVFESDRAWLLYPCDPDASGWRVPMESTNPEYPGARGSNAMVEMTPDVAATFRDLLESDGPLTAEMKPGEAEWDIEDKFKARSAMFMAVHPKLGKPWEFGLHQCSRTRQWTESEQALFKEIGGRISDGLSHLLFLRDLQDKESRYRALFESAPLAISVHKTYGSFIDVNPASCKLFGYSKEEFLDLKPETFLDESFLKKHAEDFEGSEKSGMFSSGIGAMSCKDGTLLDVEVFGAPFVHQGEKQLMAIINNITERKRLERTERNSSLVAKAIAEASLSYLETGSFESMVRLIVEHASRILGAQLGILIDLDEEQNPRILAVNKMTWETMKGGACHDRAKTEIAEKGCYSLPFAENLLLLPLREGLSVISNNPAEHPLWAGRTPEGHPAIESFLGVPMRIGDRMVGMLALGNRPGGFTNQELREAEAFAETAALALRMARSEEDRLQVEEQLRQSQKMEAVGQLAGGIAHDFNNLLFAILNYADLGLNEISPVNPVREYLIQVQKAGNRAAGLTKQLLAFSRRQVLHLVDLNLNDLVRNLVKMLQRVIRKNIALNVISGHNLGTVHADPNQIEQVLMNLVVNARDAIAEDGLITIETENVTLDSQYVKEHPWARKGRYVLLSVTDTGCGMDENMLNHIFDPFFTTKEMDRGTGLGMSMVYGIVKQHHGTVQVYSEKGIGTTIKIYLPIVERRAVEVGNKVAAYPAGGTETILLAEDEKIVRDLAVRLLSDAGYKILQACDGEEALHLFEAHKEEIDLVLLDIVMPKRGGHALLESIRSMKPGIRVLFMSGYSANVVHTGFVLNEGLQLLMKPFDAGTLLKTVREVIDA
ncbi:MAG: PAS domain S-box protein, partial [Planctomycetes bacterium]|nr:PAS domain S-box protein [Planctomycetota bacterium]